MGLSEHRHAGARWVGYGRILGSLRRRTTLLTDTAEVGMVKVEVFDLVEVLSLLPSDTEDEQRCIQIERTGERTQPCSTLSLAY